MTVRTRGIGHIHLDVTDVGRAASFYREVFGAEEFMRTGDLVFLKLSDVDAVIALDGRSPDERNPAHFGLSRADDVDLDAAVRAVERAGGRLVERGEHAPGFAYAYVADPDGNVLEL